MASHDGAMYSFYSSESEDDGASTTTIDQEDCSKKSPSDVVSFPRRLFQKFQYTSLRDLPGKGRELFEQVEMNTKIETIPLPFVKEEIQPGQEWIRGAMLCAWGTASILIINVILTIIATAVAYSGDGDKNFSHAELYQGTCSVTGTWTTGMHLVINVLSSILLAASNYVMQCLSAPSRADVNKAHSRQDWLDIGTLSLRNLWVMDTKRKILWILLFVSSLPIHMLYNTAVFSSISTIDYGIVVIPDNLGKNESLVRDEYEALEFYQHIGFTADDILAERFNGTFHNFSSLSDCINTYNVEFNTKASTLLLITERENLRGFSSLVPMDMMITLDVNWMQGQPQSTPRSSEKSVQIKAGSWNYPHWLFKENGTENWLDLLDLLYPSYSGQNVTMYDARSKDTHTLAAFIFNNNPDENWLGRFLNTASNWQNSLWAAQLLFRIDAPADLEHYTYYAADDSASMLQLIPNITVSSCMTKDADQHCQFYFSLPICLAVIACNIVKVYCMYMTARTDHREIFLTVGDALSSFLDNPDTMTRGHCFLSREDMMYGSRPWVQNTPPMLAHSNSPNKVTSQEICPQLLPKRKRWLQAASWRRWIITYILYFPLLKQQGFLLIIHSGVATEPYLSNLGISAARKLGLGKPSGSTTIVPGQNIISLALLANTPQLVFSTLYLLCNGLFTCMLAVAEYNDFATQRKPLRVSWPKGQQRSTYYLSLPYRYSAPLITVVYFLVKINVFDVHGKRVEHSSDSDTQPITSCGYSPLAMFVTIIVGIVAMTTLVGFSFRRLRSNMPLASYCSAAISAACHPPPGDEDASLKPVMWGEVRQDSSDSSRSEEFTAENCAPGYAHCSFTSKEVTAPSIGRLYC
ncbi:hypothetical protein BDV59DRAFT_207806 [Aspergillus ambiguus]|uniref:uncharacterized protein n=1 Tax=Aspergillus ambiguus TaxID=176160 RepID=UPI003CCD8E3C